MLTKEQSEVLNFFKKYLTKKEDILNVTNSENRDIYKELLELGYLEDVGGYNNTTNYKLTLLGQNYRESN